MPSQKTPDDETSSEPLPGAKQKRGIGTHPLMVPQWLAQYPTDPPANLKREASGELLRERILPLQSAPRSSPRRDGSAHYNPLPELNHGSIVPQPFASAPQTLQKLVQQRPTSPHAGEAAARSQFWRIDDLRRAATRLAQLPHHAHRAQQRFRVKRLWESVQHRTPRGVTPAAQHRRWYVEEAAEELRQRFPRGREPTYQDYVDYKALARLPSPRRAGEPASLQKFRGEAIANWMAHAHPGQMAEFQQRWLREHEPGPLQRAIHDWSEFIVHAHRLH